MSEQFYAQLWPEIFVATIALVFVFVIGSEGKHWIERITTSPQRAQIDKVMAEAKLEQARTARIIAEQDAADRAYLRALGDIDSIKAGAKKQSK